MRGLGLTPWRCFRLMQRNNRPVDSPFLASSTKNKIQGHNHFSPGQGIWSEYSFSPTFAPEQADRRERDRSLLLLSHMNMEGQIAGLEKKVASLIQNEQDVFLVDIRIKPTNNVKVFLDADNGLSIERLVQYNRRLYKDLEESGFFPSGDFSLEVSSPGLDEPLKLHRQYVKNTGRNVEVIRKDGIKNEGKLISVTNDEIILEEEKGKGKKKEVVTHTISFDNIKTTTIQIKF
jgi:ribosome maturation factor RimP